MSNSVVGVEEPGLTTRTRPLFSATNLRPSGAQSTATGELKPVASVVSEKPGGSVTASARDANAAHISVAATSAITAIPTPGPLRTGSQA